MKLSYKSYTSLKVEVRSGEIVWEKMNFDKSGSETKLLKTWFSKKRAMRNLTKLGQKTTDVERFSLHYNEF